MIQCTGLFGLLVLGTMGAAFLKGDFAAPENSVSLASKHEATSRDALGINVRDFSEIGEFVPETAMFKAGENRVLVRKFDSAKHPPESPKVPEIPGSAGIAGS